MKVRLFLVMAIFMVSCSGVEDLSDLVYPQMDSENSRWSFFSSACRPFGMVNLSPDTDAGDDWSAGYRYGSSSIIGFSHVHCWQISGVSVMPVSFIDGADIFKDCSSPFDHSKELAKVGYHKVFLERYGITAELTSTMRIGFHRYSFSSDGLHHGVLLNLNAQVGPCKNSGAVLEQIDDRTFRGSLVNEPTLRRPKPFSLFFHIVLDTPVDSVIYDSVSGNSILIVKASDFQMKVALSYTSTENAALNLQKEDLGWNFNRVVKESKKEWNSLLSRIQVEGGTGTDRARFYTDLWHALLGKRTISDCNGDYPDNTGSSFRVGHSTHRHFNTDGFWGGQCGFDNIWQLLYPEISYEQVMCLMQYYRDGGLIPRGPSGANYTYVMTGDSSCPFIVSAVQKGIVTDGLEEIYAAVKKNHEPGGIMEKTGYEHWTSTGGGLPMYLSMGYVPYPNPQKSSGFHQQGAGLTLQYSYEDYALAQFAAYLGKTQDYERYMSRSRNYRNIFDTVSGWMRPKDVDGKWQDPFDPYDFANGFIEANAAQSTWFVPHDAKGLAELMGGEEKAAARLDECMRQASELNFTSGTSHAQELDPVFKRIPINYGNQPSLQTAFMFHGFGRPDLSQYWSRRIVRSVWSGFSPSSGYNGDEDQGSMSCTAISMKIGLFQVDGGVSCNPVYQIGSPIFDRITLHLPQGKDFVIETKNNSDEHPCVGSMELDGEPYLLPEISHQRIIQGGKLVLHME